ncbi:hypothetical protein FB45DRAFT_924216 [Roridomyces roridus]|uniref:Uncharacterized protein n=1 Tax=Roridomyces roridus TaxID=1738132 RepID=A0AAD7FKC5_9AGAR|nr:hypothetical protein FB45DRAFT_924216 [Roridomyces roridus]
MPAIRRARREGRGHTTAPGLSAPPPTFPAPPTSKLPTLPGLPAFLTSSNNESTGGTRGYSTETTPLFLRRPKRSSVADDLIQHGRDASQLLGDISNSLGGNGGSGGVPGPWETLQLVATSAALVFDTVGSVRANKTQCLQLLERVHQIVRTLINLLGDVNAHAEFRPHTGGGMRPIMLRAVDQFLETLVTLHRVLQEQSTHGLLTRILRHLETRDRLAECGEALQQALDVFNVQTTLISHSSLGSLRRQATVQHEEVLSALKKKGWAVDLALASKAAAGEEEQKVEGI